MCTRIFVVACGAMQRGTEEESIEFHVRSHGCSIDTAVLGLLEHFSIPASAKPVLQTRIRVCQIFKVKAGPRIPACPAILQLSVLGPVGLLLTLCKSFSYFKRKNLKTFLVAVPT